MAVFTTICGDTWMGIYRDDKLIYQDHNIDWNDLLKLVENERIEYFGRYECSLDWLDSVGHFPNQLGSVIMLYMGQEMPFYEYLEKSGT